MKNSKYFGIMAIVFSVITLAGAQEKPKGQGPEGRAEREKQMLYRHISDLTDEQKEEIEVIFSSLKEDMVEVKQSLEKIREEKINALNNVLTEEQQSKLEDFPIRGPRGEMRRGDHRRKDHRNREVQQRQFNPEAMAQREKQLMYDSIQGLSEDQKLVIDEIYTQYGKDLQKSFDEASGDREAMRTAMQEVRQNKQQLLKEILTEEQWAKAEELARQVRERRRGRRPQQKR